MCSTTNLAPCPGTCWASRPSSGPGDPSTPSSPPCTRIPRNDENWPLDIPRYYDYVTCTHLHREPDVLNFMRWHWRKQHNTTNTERNSDRWKSTSIPQDTHLFSQGLPNRTLFPKARPHVPDFRSVTDGTKHNNSVPSERDWTRKKPLIGATPHRRNGRTHCTIRSSRNGGSHGGCFRCNGLGDRL